MKETPILFSTQMVQAILDGRKTQTRRIVKAIPRLSESVENTGKYLAEYEGFRNQYCPYGHPGDLLWVKETFKPELVDTATCEPRTYYYLADNPAAQRTGIKFKSPRFMPKTAARIWLQIENIGVERLQNISEKDAQAEGMRPKFSMELDPYKSSFKHTWEAIHGSGAWNINPWLWVITFKVISTTGKQNLELC